MSKWYEPKKDDISFSEDKTELHVYLESDYDGAVYVSIKVDDIKHALDDNKII